MELFTKLFGNLLAFVYHCFDRIVIHGYFRALSRPEQVVYFFRQVGGRHHRFQIGPNVKSLIFTSLRLGSKA
jgi:hypothetical protein